MFVLACRLQLARPWSQLQSFIKGSINFFVWWHLFMRTHPIVSFCHQFEVPSPSVMSFSNSPLGLAQENNTSWNSFVDNSRIWPPQLPFQMFHVISSAISLSFFLLASISLSLSFFQLPSVFLGVFFAKLFLILSLTLFFLIRTSKTGP